MIKNRLCASCNKKISIFSKYCLRDGSLICSKCFDTIPQLWKDFVGFHWGKSDFLRFKNLYYPTSVDTTNNYKIDYSYKIISVNKNNYTFILKPIKKYIFYMQYIVDCSFVFTPSNAISPKQKRATGKLELYIQSDFPKIKFTIPIATCITVKIFFDNGNILYKLPNNVIQFQNQFFKDINECKLRKKAQQQADAQANTNKNINQDKTENNSSNSSPSEIDKAMMLFMINSLDEIDKVRLKKIRNKLIKSFHPDSGDEEDTSYAQRINDAYKILSERI